MAMTRSRKTRGAQHVDQRIAALKDDIDSIQSDMKGLAGSAGKVAQENIEGARAFAEGLVSGARSRASDGVTAAKRYTQKRLNKTLQEAEDVVDRLSDEVEGWASENADSARETIRNQPLAACVLSMSAGALIGALLLRR
jgi:ElaB/YqjD/DUF883 family membrane-anchored ribosome-binding protein